MKRTHVKDYAEVNGQEKTARLLGLTQGAISKMIRKERNVFIIDDGKEVRAVEEKVIGST